MTLNVMEYKINKSECFIKLHNKASGKFKELWYKRVRLFCEVLLHARKLRESSKNYGQIK